ncbi:hypothetical protein ACWDFH_12400 [Streptomyces kronopolitis]
MSQPDPNIAELLAKIGDVYYDYLLQLTPKEREENRLLEALVAEMGDLDSRVAVACCLCLRERPRASESEPPYYPSDECEYSGEPWHYDRGPDLPAAEDAVSAKSPAAPRHLRLLK